MRNPRSLSARGAMADSDSVFKPVMNASYRSISTIIFQKTLEAFAGEEDAALDSAERKAHLFCDLAVFVSGDIHREGDAILLRECVDGHGYFLGGHCAFGSAEA